LTACGESKHFAVITNNSKKISQFLIEKYGDSKKYVKSPQYNIPDKFYLSVPDTNLFSLKLPYFDTCDYSTMVF